VADCQRTSSSTGCKPVSDAEPFFDTSVLLYLFSSESEKADCVENLLVASGVISVQVLNEFASVGIRKLKMTWADVCEVLDTVRSVCRTEPLTVDDHDRAGEVMERYKFSFYDSVIVASALRAESEILYTEDLQHAQLIEQQLKVVNPFR
jgi:predicted nucleic acid-binding protein